MTTLPNASDSSKHQLFRSSDGLLWRHRDAARSVLLGRVRLTGSDFRSFFSSPSHSCLIRLRSGEFGGKASTLSSLQCPSKRSDVKAGQCASRCRVTPSPLGSTKAVQDGGVFALRCGVSQIFFPSHCLLTATCSLFVCSAISKRSPWGHANQFAAPHNAMTITEGTRYEQNVKKDKNKMKSAFFFLHIDC